MKRFIGIALLLAAAVWSVVHPAQANATPEQDAQFFALVDHMGLTYQSADVAILQARGICYDMDELGFNAGQIVYRAMEYYKTTFDESVKITAIAITVYCPWNDPRPAVKR